MKYWLVVAVLLCSVCSQQAQVQELNVFIVAHSHDDAGWLRTVDAYYEWEVAYILDTTIACLLENPNRKFIEVEIAFFSRWWNDQTDSKKTQVRELVKRGQLEFVNGGWVMNDEAITNYDSVINQMTEGHLFLLEEFGVVPKIAWHIDPFGSGSVTPSLWAEAGFEAFIINRIDYRLKEEWRANQELEFVWAGSTSLGKSAEMFTHVLGRSYCTPPGWDWEHGVSQNLPEGDGPPVIITNPPSYVTPENVRRRAFEFAEMAKFRASMYKTNNVLIPFGCDFNFQNAWMKYKNMDKLIDYINEHSFELGIRAQYSTVSDYIQAVHDSNQVWNVRHDDFFPYIDDSTSYWTGFYTSRPDLKQLCRETDSIMRNSEALIVLSVPLFPNLIRAEIQSNIQLMRRAAALSQHHDAVTGTERRVAYRDYKKRLNHGAEAANGIACDLLSQLTDVPSAYSADNSTLWDNLENGVPVSVLVYNSLEFTRTQYQKLNVPSANINVTTPNGEAVIFQVSDALSYDLQGYELFIKAESIPPLGFKTFIITPTQQTPLEYVPSKTIQVSPHQHKKHRKLALAYLENEYLSVGYDPKTGQLQSLESLVENYQISLVQNVSYYYPTDAKEQTSGAYIFRPADYQRAINTSIVEFTLIDGPLVKELKTVYNESYITQVVRMYTGLDSVMGNYVDVEMHLGPLDIDTPTRWGKEYVTRFFTSLNNNNVFYTDDSGLEMQRRITNLTGRPKDHDAGVALSGNYYPVVSRIYLRQENEFQFTVLTAHSHGGSSLLPGEIELMVHRRLLEDDNRGVGQALDDPHEVTPRFFLLGANPNNSSALHRRLANVIQYPMQPFFLPLNGSVTINPNSSRFAPLTNDLPYNIRIISLKQRDQSSNEVIMRLMNIFEVGENTLYSHPVQLDLNTLFAGYTLSNIEERTLTTNRLASDNVRPVWNTTEEIPQTAPNFAVNALSRVDTVITLYPMQIQSFWVEFSVQA